MNCQTVAQRFGRIIAIAHCPDTRVPERSGIVNRRSPIRGDVTGLLFFVLMIINSRAILMIGAVAVGLLGLLGARRSM
jgi:hypothetical protein